MHLISKRGNPYLRDSNTGWVKSPQKLNIFIKTGKLTKIENGLQDQHRQITGIFLKQEIKITQKTADRLNGAGTNDFGGNMQIRRL